MAMCPILKKECIKEQRAWWEEFEFRDKYKKGGRCVVTFLPIVNSNIVNVIRALPE